MSVELQKFKDNALEQSLNVPAQHKADNVWGNPLNSLHFARRCRMYGCIFKFCLNKYEDDGEDIHFGICGQENLFLDYSTTLF